MKSARLFGKSIADACQFVLQLAFIIGKAFFLLFGFCELVFNGGHMLFSLCELIAARARCAMRQNHGEKKYCHHFCHDAIKS